VRRRIRYLVALGAALLLVVGAITVLVFVMQLLQGRLEVGGAIGALVGAAVMLAVMRTVPGPRLLAGYSSLVYFVLFFPIVIVVIYAFNAGRQVQIWNGISTKWFAEALKDDSIRTAIGRSLRIALASALVSVALGTAAALALGRAQRVTRVPFDVVMFLTIVVPELVIAIASLVFFSKAGFQLGLVTMFLAHTTFNVSLVTLIVRSRYVSMGSTLEEASADLGAGAVATFRQITLPRLSPAIVAGGLLAFTFSFDDVVISNFTSGAGNQTWPLRILSALKFGLSPEVNATATMMLAVTMFGLGLGAAILHRASRREGGGGLGTLAQTAPAVPVVNQERLGPGPEAGTVALTSDR